MKVLQKIISALLSVAVVCTAFAGCTKESAADIEGVKNYVAPAADTEGTLKVLTSTTEKPTFDVAKTLFNTKYPKVEVEITIYNELSQSTATLEKLQARQMAGDGADIVLVDDYAFGRICDYKKVQQAGAYIDLNQYFNKDPDWSWDGYSKAVVDGMMQGNKLYMLPLYFDLPVLITTDELLAESGIDLDKCDTGIGLMEQLTKCAEQVNAGERDFTVIDVNLLTPFHELFDVNPVSFDSGKGVVKFTKDFEKTLEAYDALGQQLGWFEEWTDAKSAREDVIWGQTYYERLIENHNIFIIGNGTNYDFQGMCTVALKGTKPQIVPIYTADGSGIAAKATDSVTIATGCKNPALAYEFIKCLLSEEAQGKIGSDGTSSIYAQPINKAAVKYVAGTGNKFIETVTDASGNEVELSYLDYVEQYIALADKVVYTYTNSWYYETTENYFWSYFERKKSLENCYDDAETQLTIYATE